MALVSVHAGCHAGGGRHRDAVVSCDHAPHVHARAKRASAVSVTLEALRISHPLALEAEDAFGRNQLLAPAGPSRRHLFQRQPLARANPSERRPVTACSCFV